MTPRSLSVEAIWDDPDMVEVRVVVSNERFSGTAHVYVAVGDLVSAAREIRGFPSGPRDERRVVWGTEGDASGLGRVDLLFSCHTGAGHSVLRGELTSGNADPHSTSESVRLLLPFEAAALDRFVDALLAVDRAKRGTAVLEGAA